MSKRSIDNYLDSKMGKYPDFMEKERMALNYANCYNENNQ
jgi:hypothetical protein